MKVAVTGASGFVGAALCRELAGAGHDIQAIVRRPGAAPANTREFVIADIWDIGSKQDAFRGAEVVFHLAAHTHTKDPDPDAAHQVNVAGTEAVVRAAIAAQVPRIVYLSTVKVFGETSGARPLTEHDMPRPQSVYGRTKLQAETVGGELARTAGVVFMVLRSPLVYGPGVRANFLNLMKLVDLGIPLPFGAVRNQRSLIYVGNLVDALSRAASSGHGGTFVVSDQEDVSTPELIRRIAHALGRRSRLVAVPVSWLKIAARLLRRGPAAERLLGSLAVDSTGFTRAFGWRPPTTMRDGLAETAAWYRSSQPHR